MSAVFVGRQRVLESLGAKLDEAGARHGTVVMLAGEMLTLSIQSMLILPHLLPQLARLIVGGTADDEDFVRRQDALLEEPVRRLAP